MIIFLEIIFITNLFQDSVICQWDEHGKEISKVCAHQGGSIWSADLRNSLLVGDF